MEKKFDEKVFLAEVKQLGRIVPYFSTEPTAKNFLQVVIMHCGFREEEVYEYIGGLIVKNRPDIKKNVFDLKGWKRFYNCIIKRYRDVPRLGELLETVVDHLEKPEVYEKYFKLVAETLNVEAGPLMDYYIIHRTGWIKIADTLYKMANETDITETVVSEPEERTSKKTIESEPETIHPKSEEASLTPVAELSEPVPMSDKKKEELKKTPTVRKSKSGPVRKGKRGYDVPVLQYTRGETFKDLDSASKKTGIPVEEILSSLETKPEKRVDCIWKYKNSQKKELVRFVYLHTYRNQNDINVSSEKVCGKKIHHNNVTPKLKKEWSPVSREEFLWIQSSDKDTPSSMETAA